MTWQANMDASAADNSIPLSLPTKQTVMIPFSVMIITLAKAKRVSDPNTRAKNIITIAWAPRARKNNLFFFN